MFPCNLCTLHESYCKLQQTASKTDKALFIINNETDMHSQAYNLIYLHLFLQWNDGPQTRCLLWEFLVSRRQTAL